MLKRFVLFIGLVFIIIGGVLFAITIKAKIENREDELNVNEYSFIEDISKIELKLDISDVEIKKAEDGKTSVVCYETEELYHDVSYKDNTLAVESKDNRTFFNRYITLFSPRIRLIISLPNNIYDNLKINLATGDINVAKGIQFADANIKASTGDVEFYANVSNSLEVSASTGDITIKEVDAKNLTVGATTGKIHIEKVNASEDIKIHVKTGGTSLIDSTCKNIDLSASTGSVSFKNFIASEGMKVKTSTGDVKFDRSDADHLDISTSTGDVTGNLLTGKTFHAHTSTGIVNVPNTTGGECNIETSTGNIKITISE